MKRRSVYRFKRRFVFSVLVPTKMVYERVSLLKEVIIDDLKRVTSILRCNEMEYLNKEIAENLDEDSQNRLFTVLQLVLKDEMSFLLEIEIRRQNIRGVNVKNNILAN